MDEISYETKMRIETLHEISLRQLKGNEGFLKTFCRKIRRAEDVTTCFQTLANMGLRKEFQAVGDRTLYVCLATRSQSAYA